MNTMTSNSAALQRHRQKKKMQRRIACLVVSVGVLSSAAIAANNYYQRNVQVLDNEINSLNSQVVKLTTRNQRLSDMLQKSDDQIVEINKQLQDTSGRLKLFVDTTEVLAPAPAPTIYNVPLSKDLQAYTYDRCVDYGISGHYELVLAIMWQESNYTPDLISRTDDYGIMQINRVNCDWLSKLLGTTDFMDAYQNINAGTYVISKLLHKYKGDHKALMAYNMGEAGASTHWSAGIYTSCYSRGVVTKCKAIKANRYNVK